MDNIEANIDAIKKKNVELSTELAFAREQLDKVNLEFVLMKQDNINAMNDVAAKHEEEIYNFVELAGVGTIDEVKHILRIQREITEKNKVKVEKHRKIQILDEQLQQEKRGLFSCHEDTEALMRRLYYTTSEHDEAAKRARKCRPGPKARKKLARLSALEAATHMVMHSDHHELETEASE